MLRLLISVVIISILVVSAFADTKLMSEAQGNSKLMLDGGWSIQSSARVKESGAELSTKTEYSFTWYPATVPSTVVGTLVENKVYPDPFFGMNLRTMPGCSYPIGANFSNLPMPEDSPYKVSWWYLKHFHIPENYRGENIWLHFDGINFRANIWLNGRQIANSKEIAGTFRIYELNISDVARVGEMNTLAVEVFPSHPDDLAWTWVDWNPTPPDKNMGIFRDVYLTKSGSVTLRYPQVITHFDLPSLETAHLTVNAEAHNATDHEIEGTLNGRIEGISFSQKVRLGPQETRQVTFTPSEFQQLNLRNPRLWWPVHLGPQNLYDLEMEFEVGGKVSDSQTTRFGVREVTSEVDDKNHRVFKINSKKILIRGGGWAGDMFLRFMPERLETEMQYVKDMNLNTIRLEGKLESDYFFDLADRYGILIMPGWCCCDHWEHWQHREDYKEGPTWDQDDYDIAARSQADQIRRLRNHPSVFVWLNGSDNPPPPRVERMYIEILEKYHWPNPYLSSATAKKTDVTGTTGVKMEGPYEWVPPSYWTEDKELGGAHGFATEISPGPAVPPVESLRRMLPREHLWPIDDYWNFHAGGGQFKTLKVFTDALSARYGAAKSLEDYAMKSQLMTYEGERAMFEAYGRNRYTSSGVIQWMLNNAWPSMIWHLYDYYLMPGGGYFGTKKACEPVHVQYSYDDKSVVAVNTTYELLRNLKLEAVVYDINLVERFAKVTSLDLAADSNHKAFSIPRIKDLSSTYFLQLTLQDSTGRTISSNFYWLSTRDDALNWKKSTWYYTPTTSYADMKQLQNLKPVKLSVNGNVARQGETEVAHLSISNPSRSLGFFIRLQIKQGRDGKEVLPVIWQDNYFSLMPGERREITATYSVKARGNAAPYLSLEGMNILKIQIPIENAKRR